MQATDPHDRDDINVVGYRYYAMEEAFHWIKKHGWWRPILYMSPDEKKAWLDTVSHHIGPDKNGAGHLYFTKNRNIFGKKFREYCDKKLGSIDVASVEQAMKATKATKAAADKDGIPKAAAAPQRARVKKSAPKTNTP